MAQTMTIDRQSETATPVVEIVIPVYNEERDLEASVRRLRSYLDESFPFPTVVTIADNASTDRTWSIATLLACTLPGVEAVHLDQKGRGRALRATWLASTAEVVAYMDVDLSTDLDALLPLVAPLLSGHSQVAIGSRLAPGSFVVRGPKREVISRGYNCLLRTVLRNRFTDAQCGFKALRREAANALIPLVRDDQWFFDTELLILAERSGMRIHEVPVDWVDNPDSTVHIARTARDDLLGMWRLAHRQTPEVSREHFGGKNTKREAVRTDELARYTSVGIVSTVAYLVCYLALRNALGTYGANTLALAMCTAGNTIAHARLTFRPRTVDRLRNVVLVGLVGFATSLGFTSLALAFGQLLGATSPLAEVSALVLATAVAALVRFVLLQAWTLRMRFRSVSQTTRTVAMPADEARGGRRIARGSQVAPRFHHRTFTSRTHGD